MYYNDISKDVPQNAKPKLKIMVLETNRKYLI